MCKAKNENISSHKRKEKQMTATADQLKDIEKRMWDWAKWSTEDEGAYDAWANSLTRERASIILDSFYAGDEIAPKLWDEIDKF